MSWPDWMRRLEEHRQRNSSKPSSFSEPRELIQICSWCLPRRIRVLNKISGAGFVFTVDQVTGHVVRVTRGETELILSHGICAECAEKLRPEPAGVQ